MSKLQVEIQQSKPFESPHEELWLNLSRTAAIIGHEVEQTLRPFGLSTTQYNVLRILRGASHAGLMQHEVGERLVALVPDVPRILSRMEKAGWINRVRGDEDKRVVRATLTGTGLELVNGLDATMRQAQSRLFATMSGEEIVRANELLVLARSGVGLPRE